MPGLEKNLEKDWLKWVELLKESVVWITDAKKVKKLEGDVTKLERSISQLRSIY